MRISGVLMQLAEIPNWLLEELSRRPPTERASEASEILQEPLPDWVPPRVSRGLVDTVLRNLGRPEWSPAEEARLRSAASVIPAIDREVWLHVGMAFHSTGSPNAFKMWDTWSRTCSEKYHDANQQKTWESFGRPRDGASITVATIYRLARERGWNEHSADNYCESDSEERSNGPGKRADGADGSHSSSDDALIGELASRSILTYAKCRKEAAKQLGIGVTALDKAVMRRRAELEGEANEEPAFLHWTVEQWSEPVDGDALISALLRRIQSHVVMTRASALTVALWIMLAWVHEEAVHSPILMVTSPEPDCGKSTLLGLVSFLVPRSLPSVGISPAALFRAIEKWGPTLMIDEADNAFALNEDLRAVVNSGWTRGQGVVRCDGDDNEPRLFSTFCPKAIGLKGKKLPDTTASRAIVIELKRKLAHENVADFRHVDDSELHVLRQKLLRWATDSAEGLKEASPTLPPGFANRLAANWHLPLAIAEAAGSEWPEKAREAATTIARLKATLDSSIGNQLLSDIRNVFGSGTDRLFSLTLIEKLTADPEGAWTAYNRGKSFTQKQLASRLRDYGIQSETIWIDNKSAKGYKRTAFEDVWTRYLQA